MANAAAPQPKENMGAPAPRYDARLKVTGEARYPADMPLANPAYAVLVMSTIAKGTINSLDLDDALAVAGVLDILTKDNTSALNPVKFGEGSCTSIEQLGPESVSQRADYRGGGRRYIRGRQRGGEIGKGHL